MGATEPTGHGVSAEPDRVSKPMVLRFGVVVAVLTIASMLLMGALFRFLDRSAERRDAAAADAAGLQLRPEVLPPPPRLQINAEGHWRAFRSAEEAQLSTYGWMDRSTGAVHIPIDRAMELVARRGVGPLPAAPAVIPGAPPAPTPAAAGAHR